MNELKRAVLWAKEQLGEHQKPEDHGFIDLVRQYLEDNSIEHEPLSFADVKPYLD